MRSNYLKATAAVAALVLFPTHSRTQPAGTVLPPASTLSAEAAERGKRFLDVLKTISNASQTGRVAGEVATELTGQNLDARAQAETVMNNPQNAFLQSIPAPVAPTVRPENQQRLYYSGTINVDDRCPGRVPVCNPIGTDIYTLFNNPRTTFSAECSLHIGHSSEGFEQAILVDVECAWRDGVMTTTVLGTKPQRPEYSRFPVVVRNSRNSVSHLYNGYSLLNFCVPCKSLPEQRPR